MSMEITIILMLQCLVIMYRLIKVQLTLIEPEVLMYGLNLRGINMNVNQSIKDPDVVPSSIVKLEIGLFYKSEC